MAKAKVGDRIKIVAAENPGGVYDNADTGVVEKVEDNGVYVEFDHTDKYGTKIGFFVYHTEYEVVNSSNVAFRNQKNQHNNLKPSAEEVRENILSLRIERERLKESLSGIDKQEAEMLELLKEMGFVLHEITVKSGEKVVLYAEDIEEDMTDRGNWKVGDVFVCTNWDNAKTYRAGDVCHMVGIEDDIWPILKSNRTGYSTGIALTERFKFLYRPVNN